jgi:hypothetical protein
MKRVTKMCDKVLGLVSNVYPFMQKWKVEELKLIPIWIILILIVVFLSINIESSQILMTLMIAFTLLMPIIFYIASKDGYEQYEYFDILTIFTKFPKRYSICISYLLTWLILVFLYYSNY